MPDPGTSYPNPDAYQTALGNALPPSNHELAQALLAPFGSSAPAFQNRQFIPKEQLDWNRKLAAQLLTPMQVHRPMEGFANVLRSAVGGNLEFQSDMAAQGAQSAYTDALARVAGAARGDGSASAPQPTNGGTSDDAGAAPSDTAKTAMSYYQNKGLSPVAAAGLAGGFANEGSPTSVNPGDGADGSASIGIGQWNGPRAQALQKFASDNRRDPKDLNTQLDFSWQELNGPEKATLAALQAAKTPQDAAVAAAGYERPAGWSPQNPTGAAHFDRRLASANSLLQGAATAPAAIASAAPPPGPAATPPGAMAFTGPQGSPQGGMLSVAPPGSPQGAAPIDSRNAALAQVLLNGTPPQQGPTPQNRALAHALIHGTPPQGPSPQDLAIALGSPWGTPEGRAVASHMLTPEVISDSVGNQYAYRNAQQPTPLLPGVRVQMVQIGNSSVPIAISGDPRNPTIRLLSPTDGTAAAAPTSTGAAPSPASAPPAGSLPADRPTRNGPMSGYGPIIEQGQGIQAQGEAAVRAGAASGDQYAKDRAVAGDFATSMYPLQQAAHALDALGPTNTGPGTDGLNRVKSILQSAGIPGFDSSKIQNYDDARQFIAGYVGQHGGTDKLVGAFSGDPTANVSNAAASDLVKSALALNRMQQAKVLAFRQSGLPESRYSDFASDFASRADPRAYGLDQMSDAAKQKLYASMPAGSPERARFAASVRNALQTGMINQPTR